MVLCIFSSVLLAALWSLALRPRSALAGAPPPPPPPSSFVRRSITPYSAPSMCINSILLSVYRRQYAA